MNFSIGMRVPRYYFKLNFLRCSKYDTRCPLLFRSINKHEFGGLRVLRCLSNGKILDGPSLKDFISGAVADTREQTQRISESAPYLDKLDFNGDGRKVYFAVYGCQMNVSDIEIVWSILQKNNYTRVTQKNEADVVLVMTCAIREGAEDKIWDEIKKLNALKKTKKHLKIGILGCMAERLKDKIIESQKAVDLVAGPDSYRDLPRMLALTRNNQKAVNVLLSMDETYADITPVRLDENQVTAFVSIMRGCDNMCTYCIVPFTRGRERSRPLESILREVRELSEKGVKQVTLLGQNVNSYRDVSIAEELKEPTKLSAGFKTVYKNKVGGLRFATLLDQVSQVDPEMRIRFTAPHPKDFPDEVLHLIRDRKNICCSIHLSAQSGSTAVLQRMRRGYSREAYLDLVSHIRSILPDVSLQTDIIVGFCGETEEEHQETLDLIRKVGYSFVFNFAYSVREKTTAHRRYADDVPPEVKKRRALEVSALFRSICRELNEAQVGQTQLVLVDGFSRKSKDVLQGRNDGNTKVLIPSCSVASAIGSSVLKPIAVGDYIAVRITEGNSQQLKGTPLYHTSLVGFEGHEKVLDGCSRGEWKAPREQMVTI